MADAAIWTDGLGKRYRAGEQDRYLMLRDALARLAAAPLRRLRRERAASWFWALRDVGLEIPRGSVTGIVGRNGSGKTTLLRILARVTRPTEGVARVRGRVGTLLEVGAGFHGELTGRENVRLSGAILGMSRREIARRMEEIIAFAGVERFADTPLKRYSSGMRMRLAFAVAAHLEPEILLVDEALAVGDAEFQDRCLDTMERLCAGGRTVVFVSHEMRQVRRLCPRVVWLDAGRVIEDGPGPAVLGRYERAMSGATASHAGPTTKLRSGEDE